jgi:hypothetical protein
MLFSSYNTVQTRLRYRVAIISTCQDRRKLMIDEKKMKCRMSYIDTPTPVHFNNFIYSRFLYAATLFFLPDHSLPIMSDPPIAFYSRTVSLSLSIPLFLHSTLPLALYICMSLSICLSSICLPLIFYLVHNYSGRRSICVSVVLSRGLVFYLISQMHN